MWSVEPWDNYYVVGGRVLPNKVASLDSLSNDYDIVINCSGLVARDLCRDFSVVPMRGQVMPKKQDQCKNKPSDTESRLYVCQPPG